MTRPALLGGVVIRAVGVIGTLLGAALLVTAVAGRSRRWLPGLGLSEGSRRAPGYDGGEMKEAATAGLGGGGA
jgi:hypothetical protein